MSKVFKGVKKVFKKVTKAVGKVFKAIKKILPVALAAGAVVFTAGAALGALPTWGAAVGSLVKSMGATGLLAKTLTGAVTYAGYGAVTGGLTSALTGGKITKGMMMGALGGAITGGVLGGMGVIDPGGFGAAEGDLISGGTGDTTLAGGDRLAMDAPKIGPGAGGTPPAGQLPTNPPATSPGVFGAGGWLERNQQLVGGLVKGVGQGLMSDDRGDAYARAYRERQSLINDNYRGLGPGLLRPDDRGYLAGQPQRPTPEQRFDPSTYGGRYVFDPQTGRIVLVPQQQQQG